MIRYSWIKFRFGDCTNILSWNINGYTKSNTQSINEIILSSKYDLILFQETKSTNIPLHLTMSGYKLINFPSSKINYGGTLSAVRKSPISILKGIGKKEFDYSGRVTTLEYDNFFVINAYFPFAGDFLFKIDTKMRFLQEFEQHCIKLKTEKPLIICGDLNIAHEDVDRTFGDENMPGFSLKERLWLTSFLNLGFIDSFRFLHKNVKKYSSIWYNNKNKADRLDYCILSKELVGNLKSSDILDNVSGSDHLPTLTQLELKI